MSFSRITGNPYMRESESYGNRLLNELLHIASANNDPVAIADAIRNGAEVDSKDSQGNTALQIASHRDNHEIIELLLANKADVTINDLGYTAFHIAAEKGNLQTARAILNNQDNPNIINDTTVNDIKTPLMLATENKNIAMVGFLLARNAEVDVKDNLGNTAMFYAVASGSEAIVEMLCEKGANVNEKNTQGFTPLKEAVKKQDPSMTQLLLKKGADVNFCNDNKESILMYASTLPNKVILETLFNNADVSINYVDHDGNSALHAAARYLRSDNTLLLLQKGAEVNVQNNMGQTPIMTLQNFNNEMNVRMTIVWLKDKDKANLNIRDRTNKTAAIVAAEKGANWDIISKLVTPENISQKDFNKNTIFHIIAKNRPHLDCSKLIIYLKEQGIHFDLDIKNNDGDTPLMVATKSGNIDALKVLIEEGANINTRNNEVKTPLEKAVKSGFSDIVKLLLEKDATITFGFFLKLHSLRDNKRQIASNLLNYRDANEDTIFHKAVSIIGNDEALFHGFIAYLKSQEFNFDFETKNDNGETPLMLAVKSEKYVAARKLTNEQANIDTPDNEGNTPLQHAVKNNLRVMVILLLRRGANINTPDNEGNTPIINAAKKGYLDIVNLLADQVDVNKGYPPNHWTALSHATQNGHASVVTTLLEKGATIGTGFTALMIAAKSNQIACLRTLLANPTIKAKIDAKDQTGKTALMYAAENGHVDSLRLLIENGANYHIKDSNNRIAMFHAAINDRRDAVNYLIDTDRSWPPWSTVGQARDLQQALMLVSGYGKNDIVRLLIEKGASINPKPGNYTETPLHRACRYGQTSSVRLLLELGANINAEIKRSSFYYGKTPLMIAAENGKIETTNLLLENPECLSKINQQDNYHENWTALDYAIGLRHERVMRSLQAKGALTHR